MQKSVQIYSQRNVDLMRFWIDFFVYVVSLRFKSVIIFGSAGNKFA